MNNTPKKAPTRLISLDNFHDFVYITNKGSSFREDLNWPRGPASTDMAAHTAVWRRSHLVTDETFHVNA